MVPRLAPCSDGTFEPYSRRSCLALTPDQRVPFLPVFAEGARSGWTADPGKEASRQIVARGPLVSAPRQNSTQSACRKYMPYPDAWPLEIARANNLRRREPREHCCVGILCALCP